MSTSSPIPARNTPARSTPARGDDAQPTRATRLTRPPRAVPTRRSESVAADTLAFAIEARTSWAARGLQSRVRAIRRVARYIDDHREGIATTVRRDTTTTVFDVLAREVLPAPCVVDAYCDQACSQGLRRQSHGQAIGSGVVAVLCQRDSPFLAALTDTVAALLDGNAVVLLGDRHTRHSAAMIAESVEAAPLPADGFQYIESEGLSPFERLCTAARGGAGP